ncbi:MAG: HAD family hydrolase [Verrucomicrobia bacterium]|nr:HAD family hydrolase [Verrucomicrobiota bacterium]
MSTLRIRLVLFDIDGTLLHTGGAGRKAFRETFATAFGVSNAIEGVEFSGRTDTSLVRELFRRHGIEHTPAHVQQFFSCYYQWLGQILEHQPGKACPGVWEFMEGLRSSPAPPLIGLLTGNVRLGAEIKLRQFGMWQEFVTGGFGDDHEDRGQIARIAKDRGSWTLGRELLGEEVMVIGDTPLDVACARAIGAPCLAVATGGATLEQLRESQPRWATTDLTTIPVQDLLRG